MTNDEHGGLRLPPGMDGVGATEEGEIHGRWAKSEEVNEYVSVGLGISPPKEPDYPCPELKVEDLTTPDADAYTENFAKRTAWFGFLSEKKAEHDAVVLELEAEMEDISTNIRDSLRRGNTRKTRGGEAKAPPLAEMTDAVNKNPRYLELKKKLLFHQQVLVRLTARIGSLDRELRLTSRQVEIRRLEFESSNRQSNVTGNRGLPTTGAHRLGVGYRS